ncbi:MAG: leucine-rich repeat domain-containing protein, partial [Oscillospiraceae bacterium]|nr:leucine-rich repeat domain-containing protein [Oscillospiraceae bacterium]
MAKVRKNRLFSIFSVVLIFLFIFAFNSPLLVLATEVDEIDESSEPVINYCGKEATWELENGTLTIGGNGAIANYSETDPAPWSDRLSEINTIIIKNGISSIGNYAFANTTKLTKAVIANSVEFIGIGAFYATGISEINMPNSIKTISKLAFANSQIKKINLSKGLKYVAERVFY